MEFEITRVSPKGQVVIPSQIRTELGIKPSDKFLVFGENSTVVFKKIDASFKKSFRELTAPLKMAVKKSGFKRKDLDSLIKDVRAEA